MDGVWLFDVQAPLVVDPLEQRIMQSIARACFGALICWVSVQKLLGEVSDYKTIRHRKNR